MNRDTKAVALARVAKRLFGQFNAGFKVVHMRRLSKRNFIGGGFRVRQQTGEFVKIGFVR